MGNVICQMELFFWLVVLVLFLCLIFEDRKKSQPEKKIFKEFNSNSNQLDLVIYIFQGVRKR